MAGKVSCQRRKPLLCASGYSDQNRFVDIDRAGSRRFSDWRILLNHNVSILSRKTE
jgi:hypothetical protein